MASTSRTRVQMFRLVFGISNIFLHRTRSSICESSCRFNLPFVQHELLNLDVIRDTNRLFFCLFLRVILDHIGNHRRFVWRIQDLLRQTGNERDDLASFSCTV